MSGLTLERYAGAPDAWDAFVERANDGTLFHRLGFLAYRGTRFADTAHHLAWSLGGTLRAVLPLAIALEEGVLVARSPYSASYGSIVTGEELSLKAAEELVGSLVEYLRAQHVRKLVLVPAPGINFERPHDYVNFWFLKHGARCVKSELTSYIDVCEEPLECFTYSAAKSVRKAKANGVTVEESRDVDPFYEILVANRQKFGATPTHTRDEIAWLLANLPDHVKLFLARHEQTPIAGSLVFRVNRRVLLDFYWAHADAYQALRPTSLLVYEITRWAYQNGFRTFDFGTQTVDMVPIEGSTRFKETFGALGVFRHTYELDLS